MKMKELLKKLFVPSETVENLFNVNLYKLKDKKIKGIILDMDNTIIPYNTAIIDDKTKRWMEEAKEVNFKMVILSNATLGSKKVKKVAQELQLPAFTFSGKPFPFGFRNALQLLGTAEKETVIIGDQLLTDILGGNILGLYTILVRPLSSREFFTTKINRWLEKVILKLIR